LAREENVRSVTTVLKIGYLEIIDICSQLGNEQFGLLLNAHGITDGHNNPMSMSFACPGVTAVGNLKTRPCPYQECDREDMPYVYVAGIKTKDWALPHKFGCELCNDSIAQREKKAIEQLIDAKESGENVIVTEAQRERVEKRKQSNAKSNAKEREVTALKKRVEAGDETLTSPEKKRVEKRKETNAKGRETTQLMKQDISSLSTDEKVRVEKRKRKNKSAAKSMAKKREIENKDRKIGSWTNEEDRFVIESVKSGGDGFNGWKSIADKMQGRTLKQVRDRWNNQLDPKLDKGEWKDADDRRLWKAYNEIGPRWTKISSDYFAGKRSGDQVKHRFNGVAFKKKYGKDAYENAKNAWLKPASK